mmetsp:Transcript_29144/g.41234  ORF Transcript_29144/g.41234 Transcript_29144/m.41234 type:complete len:164 (+) Transcript_29144:392-883(+)
MCEHRLATMDRTEASKRRATHIKLSKDFRTVETACKNIILDTRRKLAHTATHQLPKSVFGNAPGNHETTTQEEERVQMQMQLQQERLNEEIMRERESEIRNINRGMHQVNEIYKDLAHIVSSQQEQVDQIETQMESSKVNAEQGLTHIQKANARAENSQCTIS